MRTSLNKNSPRRSASSTPKMSAATNVARSRFRRSASTLSPKLRVGRAASSSEIPASRLSHLMIWRSYEPKFANYATPIANWSTGSIEFLKSVIRLIQERSRSGGELAQGEQILGGSDLDH